MVELKPCPFCGGEAEIHLCRTSSRFYTDSKKSIPKNGTLERIIEYPSGIEYPGGVKIYEYSIAKYVPRCIDSSCLGRLGKPFPSEEEAAAAWNRRTDNA